MAEQAGTSTVESATEDGVAAVTLGAVHGGEEHHPTHHGSPQSWVAVSIIIVGFVVGGVAMVPHPVWWLFWTGAGIAVVGCIMTLFARTFDDWY